MAAIAAAFASQAGVKIEFYDPQTVRVVKTPGADGAFELYEDDFTTYACERGEFSRIPFKWNDKERKLVIAKRQGSYKGMLDKRSFRIVLADGAEKKVEYSGEPVEVRF